MGKLIVMKDDEVIQECPVGHRFTIGRALHCDLSLDIPGISPHHAQIVLQPDANNGTAVYRIRDLYSHNGTYLNNRPVSQDILQDQDVLNLGDCELTFLFNTSELETTSL